MLILQSKMDSKNGRRVKISSPAEFEVGYTAADIHRRREGKRKRGRGTETQGRNQEGGNYTLSRGRGGQK